MSKRFTIRAIFALTAALALLVAFYTNSLRGYHNEQRAFKELQLYILQSPCYVWSSRPAADAADTSSEISCTLPTPLAALANRLNTVAFNRIDRLHLDNVVDVGVLDRLDAFQHLRELHVFAIDPGSFSSFCEAAQAYQQRNPHIRFIVGEERFDPHHPPPPRVPRSQRHPWEWKQLHNPLLPREPTPLKHNRSRLRGQYRD